LARIGKVDSQQLTATSVSTFLSEYQGQRAALLGRRDTFADASKLRTDVS